MSEELFTDTLGKFQRRIDDSLNLIAIHKDLGRLDSGGTTTTTPRRGRRFRELALNRAVVVLTVAAWQAFVEDLVEAGLTALAPPQNDPSAAQYRVLRSAALNVRHNFSTPNAENTRSVLMTVGFDPWPSWAFPVPGGTAAQARTVMNAWLKVRHAIAHGDPLPDVDVLHSNGAHGRALRRANAENCIEFFLGVADQTTAHAIRFFIP